ncbi:MAG: hypothetical protein A3A98_00215 [Candidatus Staskawiczbacteria bacterium RIFCSPLOWO2_01_FULL_40_39]|uniref:Uncharacterized protein n=1 Tax=Candidatus Staskawiczbacteria bacterium RIFCSPHIGHO2_01_FULL_39_25 TaxID=1802202 RepID=A0A1G2HMP1_9BACT|nr:MAG: hypothetical protein A2730_00215 [Candidatus Staskawiczbacteria bacterium RIFCSPHIGHO2_01_FULL_39_25]OGZ73162.1 MAG: hypothetical protein A3A98_00215 [Candidatus Staskawiczbacteria bacterium RIFCSPLOWO2_01_FULL_40_39]OGZ75983.1 MAG: hypothetical protein A3I87_01400 [Candidatus Staskawiczbacteria bacterium RIFCSPLOWO2_02_FULL_39_8]
MTTQQKLWYTMIFSAMFFLSGVFFIGFYIFLVFTERYKPFSEAMITLIAMTIVAFLGSLMFFVFYRQEKEDQLLLEQKEQQEKQLTATNK